MNRLLIIILACLSVAMVSVVSAQEDESSQEAGAKPTPQINEEGLEQTITPELWEKTLQELNATEQLAEQKKLIQGLKDTFWKIAGRDQDNYYLVVHSFFRQYPRIAGNFKTDQYQDEFDLIYEELEPTYIP